MRATQSGSSSMKREDRFEQFLWAAEQKVDDWVEPSEM